LTERVVEVAAATCTAVLLLLEILQRVLASLHNILALKNLDAQRKKILLNIIQRLVVLTVCYACVFACTQLGNKLIIHSNMAMFCIYCKYLCS
jgi:hypothetical protein